MGVGDIGIDVVRIEAEPIVGGAVGGEAIVEFGGLAAQHRFFVGAFDALFDDGGNGRVSRNVTDVTPPVLVPPPPKSQGSSGA